MARTYEALKKNSQADQPAIAESPHSDEAESPRNPRRRKEGSARPTLESARLAAQNWRRVAFAANAPLLIMLRDTIRVTSLSTR